MGRLDGKTAIVTGASSGIGRAIALRFAAESARVVVADINVAPREGGMPTEEAIAGSGGIAMRMHCDVSRWEDVDALVTRTAETWGRLDIMVNNAATWTGTSLTATTEEQWREVMAVNADGYFFGC